MKASLRVPIFVRCLAAGGCIAFALPPWGWWPFAFVGLALWDRLIADVSWKRRFRRTWLVGVTWFLPSMLWMFDLTPPGYVIACAAYAAYYGVAVACVPPGRVRWLAFPGAVVLATALMWTFPFGGVPLANLALTQAGSCAPPCAQLDSPLAQAARLLGPLLVVALVVVGGIALSAAWERRWKAAGVALAVVVACTVLGWVAPKGHDIEGAGGTINVAIVQGGGPQRTRFGNEDAREVFERHVKATRELVTEPVDVILWPENVIAVEGRLPANPEYAELQALAREKDATLIVGATEGLDKTGFLNAAIVFQPDGTMTDRFDKVRTVPFGEFVPLRGLLEKIAGDSGLPSRDAIAGDGHGVLHTPAGDFGVVISWETFFDGRARDAIGNGGQILMNPTNGASYWLTEVQTQQIASSRLRAIETGRWMTQAAPTGFSALINPNGDLLARTDITPPGRDTNIAETAVIQHDVPRREGSTLATLVGPWPMLALSIAGIVVAWVLDRRRRADATTGSTGAAADADRAGAGPSGVDEAREVHGLEEPTVV